MKILHNNTKYSLGLVLLVIFVLVVLAEVYLGYSFIYSSLFYEPEEILPGSVVRVNLKEYQEAVDYIEYLENYQPDPIVLPRNNIFR